MQSTHISTTIVNSIEPQVFTAAGVGILVDEGLISWNDKITKILPELGFKDSITTKQATLIDILSHQTGLPRLVLLR